MSKKKKNDRVARNGDVLIRADEFEAFAKRVNMKWHVSSTNSVTESTRIILLRLAAEQAAPEPEVPPMPGYEWRGETEDGFKWHRDGDRVRDQHGNPCAWPTLWKAGVRQVNP